MDHLAELESLVAELLRSRPEPDPAKTPARGPAAPADAPPGPPMEVPASLARKLEDHYWGRVASIVRSRTLQENRLQFERDERLLLDAGFADPRLIQGDARALLSALVKELYAESGPTPTEYLSQWLAERHKELMIKEDLENPQEPTEYRRRLEDRLGRLRRSRAAVLKELLPVVERVPGVEKGMVQLFVSGRYHQHLEQLDVKMVSRSSRGIKESRDRFLQFYRRLLEAIRSRAGTHRETLLVTALRKVDADVAAEIHRLIVEDRRDATRVSARSADRPEARTRRAGSLVSELENLRNLLLLGTLGTEGASSCPVLLEDRPRLAAAEMAALVDRIIEYDRAVSFCPRVLIAPFRGMGFFEWDRNTLVLPLTPSMGTRETLVRAFGNYRLLSDILSNGGRLKALLGPVLGEPFRDRFVEEYVRWILQTGEGKAEAQSAPVFQAFARYVGPNPEGPVGPPRILAMHDVELSMEAEELRKQKDDNFQALRDLGTVLWCRGRREEALSVMGKALDRLPGDGRTRYALALLQLQSGRRDESRASLEELIQIRPDTLWALYAKRRLGAKASR